ncbi:ROK family protein [Sphingomonas sp. Leaf4]|uniref:ROK family protein n=1 Tax=Sphingomonas sp. Leaf4 TaxID=2876553 RepID=UPI001E370A0E|nr:ROK family protein [Sphingomonas sp. Leaf4]
MIWRRGPIARGDLVALSGLTAPSITRAIQTLSGFSLVGERIDRAGARGQPTRPVSVEVDSAYAIGVYFSHHHVEIGLVDMAGRQVETHRTGIVDLTMAAVRDLIARFIDDVLARHIVDADRLAGVGVALPADFVRDADLLHAHGFFPALREAGAPRLLARDMPLPVFVENDAASAALGERLLGAGQNIDDFLFVHIGHGVGGALILGGRLYRGVHGNAGMVGVHFPNDRPRPSGQDLFAHLHCEGVAIDDFPDLAALDIGACPPLRAWVRRAGRQLREQLSLVARLFDPQAVIIGGRLPLPLLNALVAEVDTPDFCNEGVGLPRPSVLASPLGNRAGMIGAGSLPIYRLLMDGTDGPAGAFTPGLRL